MTTKKKIAKKATTKPRRQQKDPNHPKLTEVPTRVLVRATHYMIAEAEACDDGIGPADKPAFLAVAAVCNRELRRRGKKTIPVHVQRDAEDAKR